MRGADEKWLPVVGFESFYEVSNMGRVRDAAGALRPLHNDGRGYWQVGLTKHRKKINLKVHRLVGFAFLSDHYNPLHCHIAHLDGDPKNNRVDNLKWVSRTENESHKIAHGRAPRGETNGRSKITEAQAAAIREAYDAGVSCPTLAREYGLWRSHVHRIATGQAWRHASGSSPVSRSRPKASIRAKGRTQ